MNTAQLSMAHIRKAVERLRSLAIAPKEIKTSKKAKAFNDFDLEFLGLENHWKKGDKYYQAKIHPINLKQLLDSRRQALKLTLSPIPGPQTKRTKKSTKQHNNPSNQPLRPPAK